MIKIVIERELLDLRRDRKLILGSILLPLLMLPLIGGILVASEGAHKPTIQVVSLSPENQPYVSFVEKEIVSHGGVVVNDSSNSSLPDIKIIFPADFYINASRLNSTDYVCIVSLISSSGKASQIVDDSLYDLELNMSYTRIYMLEHGIPASNIRSPLYVKQSYVTPSGSQASSGQNQLAQLSRLISFILFPSVTPVVLFVVDSFAGERERRTLESLLATPIGTTELMISKTVASSVMGLLSSIAEIFGLIVFSLVVPYITGQSFTFSLIFLVYIFLSLMVTISLSASLSLLLMTSLGGSVRNVQLISTVILTLGLLASFSGMILNLTELNFPQSLILLIPYVQISAGIQSIASGLLFQSLFLLVTTFLFSIIILILSIKYFDPERILLK